MRGLSMLTGSSTKAETPLIDEEESEATDVKDEEEEELRRRGASCDEPDVLMRSIREERESMEPCEFSRELAAEEVRVDCDR
jgi:hypothetical protein